MGKYAHEWDKEPQNIYIDATGVNFLKQEWQLE